MIETVARAIALHESDPDWHAHVPAARAALQALLEPTTDMLEAAVPGCVDWGYLPDEWRVMILHVMNEAIPNESIARSPGLS